MIDVFYFDGKAKRGSVKDLPKLKKKQLWIDITNLAKEESELISELFKLHPLTMEDLLSSRVRVKIEEFPEYLFCVFYGLKNGSFSVEELDFVLGKNYIISSHKNGIPSWEEYKKNPELLAPLFSRGNDFIFHALLDREVDNYAPVLERIDEEIEKVEKAVVENPTPDLLGRILAIKRHLLIIRKYTFPQREKISMLTRQPYQFISKRALPYFRDLYDHSILVSDSVENYREGIVNTVEIYMSAVNNRMNEIMKTLSVIATIALPLTVISSIYGTNFANLPGAGYHYGFWWMVVLMFFISFFTLLILKRRNWF